MYFSCDKLNRDERNIYYIGRQCSWIISPDIIYFFCDQSYHARVSIKWEGNDIVEWYHIIPFKSSVISWTLIGCRLII